MLIGFGVELCYFLIFRFQPLPGVVSLLGTESMPHFQVVVSLIPRLKSRLRL